jgi:hypothetical protein
MIEKRKGIPLREPPKPVTIKQRKKMINKVLLMTEYAPKQKRDIICLIKQIPLI